MLFALFGISVWFQYVSFLVMYVGINFSDIVNAQF